MTSPFNPKFARAKGTLAVRSCIDKAKELYPDIGDKLDKCRVTFKQKGRIAAKAMWGSTIEVMINMEAYALDPDEMINDTIPHEVAHLVAALHHSADCSHDPRWQRICLALGGTAKRTHSMKLTPIRKSKRFLYRNENGAEVTLKQGRHSNLQLGKNGYLINHNTGEKWYSDHFISEVVTNPAVGRVEI